MGGAIAVDCRNNCYVLCVLNVLLTVLEHVFFQRKSEYAYLQPPTQSILGELDFHPSPQKGARPKTTFLSQTQPIGLYFPNSGKLILTAVIIARSALNTGKAFCPLINVRFRAADVTFSQILEYSMHCITLAKERIKGKRQLKGHVLVVFSLSTLYFRTVSQSLATQIKQWERNVVFC